MNIKLIKFVIFNTVIIMFLASCSAKKESQTTEKSNDKLETEEIKSAENLQKFKISDTEIELEIKDGYIKMEDGSKVHVIQAEKPLPVAADEDPYTRMQKSLVIFDHTPADFRAAKAGENVESIVKGNEINGIKEGPFEIFYTNGFFERGMFINNKREGEWMLFNRNSEHIRSDIYENGTWIGYEIFREFK